MSQERRQQISEKAYRLWEMEGYPKGRDLDHWVQAENEVGGSSKAETAASAQANEGEGNRTATRAYNRKAKADLDGPRGKEPREAKMIGKSRSHGEDPAVKRSK